MTMLLTSTWMGLFVSNAMLSVPPVLEQETLCAQAVLQPSIQLKGQQPVSQLALTTLPITTLTVQSVNSVIRFVRPVQELTTLSVRPVRPISIQSRAHQPLVFLPALTTQLITS